MGTTLPLPFLCGERVMLLTPEEKLRIAYHHDETIEDTLKEFYEELNGVKTPEDVDILTWFLTNYININDNWYHKLKVLH